MKDDPGAKLTEPLGPEKSGIPFGTDLSRPSFIKGLVFLTILGLIVRIGFFSEHVHTPSFGVPTLDQKYYDTVAKMLLRGEDLRELHGFRPLLYTMFLAMWYKLGGQSGVTLAIFVQHLLGVATGIMVALLGVRLFRNRLSGLLGGLLFMLAPVPLYFEGELLIEPSYIFLIYLGLILHWHAAETHGKKAVLLWLLAGALTVLISQARANILVFMAVYPLFAAWRWWQRRDLTALLPITGLLGAFGMMIPWGFVNMKQSDHFHLIPNAGGVTLYLGNKRNADGMIPEQDRRIAYGERYADSVEIWAREEYEKYMREQGREPETDPMAISRYWTDVAMAEIKADPASWLRLVGKKCWLTLWNAEVPNNKAFAFLQEEFAWLRWLPVRWVVLLMLAPAGIWAAAKWKNRDGLFILLVYVGLYSASNVAFLICDRYRYPVWPAMAVFGGGALVLCRQAIRFRQWPRVGWIGASMVAMAVLSLPNWGGAELPSYARDFQFRSLAWYEKGNFQEALNDINRSIELDPLDSTSFHQQGNALFALNRLEEAAVAYQQAVKILPNEASAWNNLGATFAALNRGEEALTAFRRATECTPPSQNAFLGQALTQVRWQRFDDAAASLDQYERLQRIPDATALAIRSIIERQRGHIQPADTLEQQARALNQAVAEWTLERAAKPLSGIRK